MWRSWSAILTLSFVITIISTAEIVTKAAVELQCNDRFTSYSSDKCVLSSYYSGNDFWTPTPIDSEIIIRTVNGHEPQTKIFNDINVIVVPCEFSISFSRIPKQLFRIFPNLKSFDSACSKLRTISQDDFVNARKLITLDLSVNDIEKLEERTFAMASSLTEIGIAYNKIETVADYAFDGLTKLKVIRLYANRLQKIKKFNFANLPMLKRLDLSSNQIAEIEDGAFNLPQLEHLDLGGNKLTHLSQISQLPTLRNLDLADNQIQLVNNGLYSLPALQELNLQGNKIQDFDLEKIAKLPKLTYLDMSGTDYNLKALEISSAAINSSKSPLNNFRFNNNHRTGEVIFAKLKIFPNLWRVSLINNSLKLVDLEAIRTGGLPNLKDIALEGNNFPCDWLREKTRELRINLKYTGTEKLPAITATHDKMCW